MLKVGQLFKVLAKLGLQLWVVRPKSGLADVIPLAVTHMLILEILLLISSANCNLTRNNDFLQHSIQRDPLWSLHDGPDVRPDDGSDPADDEDGEDDGLHDDVRHAGAGGLQAQCSVSGPLRRQVPVEGGGGDAD